MSKPKSVIREALVILAMMTGLYLYISLASFNPADMEADAGDIANLGGSIGARFAHELLTVFGLSAYVAIAACIYAVWIYGIQIRDKENAWLTLLNSVSGLLLFLISTSGIEGLRLYEAAEHLPGPSGGKIGFAIAKTLYDLLGFHGSSVVLMGLWFASLSLFALFSWVEACDKLGACSEKVWARTFPYLRSGAEGLKEFLVNHPAPNEPAKDRPAAPAQAKKPKPASKAPIARQRMPGAAAQSEPTLGKDKKAKTVAKKETAPVAADGEPGVFKSPPVELLETPTSSVPQVTDEELESLGGTIESKLEEFGVKADVVSIQHGPVVTRFEIQPAPKVKGIQIVNLARDLSRTLSVSSIRVLESIPGKTTMGIEVPNEERITVHLQDVINSPKFMASKHKLPMALGKNIANEVCIADLAAMPHLLVAGTTGSGKSVQINSIILSLLYKSDPRDVRMILIDPKMVELSPFDNLPHLLAPVITDMELVPSVLAWCVEEMERRYQLMAKLGVRNLAGLNEAIAKGARDPDAEDDAELEHFPLLVVVVDELADLMVVAAKKVEQLICRLAQKARAAGIHLILATQRPSVDVITGLIKANIPSRIAFQVSSKVDSRTILDQSGAETLLGKGDMLYLTTGAPEPTRIHGAFVSDEEVRNITAFIRDQNIVTEQIDFSKQVVSTDINGGGDTNGGSDNDPLFNQAVEIVMNNNRISISLVQRHLRIGYNRAARLIEDMERRGLVSPMDSSGNRKILASNREKTES